MRGFDLQRYGPVLLIVFLVVTPLAIWAATSGGSDDGGGAGFTVERAPGQAGEPELLLTVDDPDVEVEGGRTSVEVRCSDAAGKVIVKGTQPWPFPPEQGFAPHAHQPAPPDKVDRTRSCEVLGTNKTLRADVR